MDEKRQIDREDEGKTPWHALAINEVLEKVGSTKDGLSRDEALQRLEQFGPNSIAQGAKSSAWERLRRQLSNILIIILLISAVLAGLLGAWLDAGVILAVVIINTLIGFVQEGKAERAIESIRSMLSPKAVVVRHGERRQIDASEVVPGDIVLVESGDRVPADLRLLEAKSLQADEAVLTGESVASDKQTEAVEEEAELGDRFCMVYSSTVITNGAARGVVVATGEQTEIGQISSMLAHVEQLRTPLLKAMDVFGKRLSLIIVGVALLTFAIGYLFRGYELIEIFMAALSLAVAAIPEGLPAIMTITLAIGVRRMADRNAIIRRLPAVETLGSVTVICSDKTGTLTRNEMTLRTIGLRDAEYDISGVGYIPEGAFRRDGREIDPADDPELLHILRGGVLCSEAVVRQRHEGEWMVEGDPTEGALVVAAMKAGLDKGEECGRYARKDLIPFDSAHKFMATLHDDEDENVIYVKGAPDRLLEMCHKEQRRDGVAELDADWWHERIHEVASRGQRTLGIGYRRVEKSKQEVDFPDVEGELVLLGIVGMIDPPREAAIQAVDECHAAGIRVKVITGDHGVTARAVAKQMHIGSDEEPLLGRQIEELSDEQLGKRVLEVDVFARSSPEHKLRLVQALQRHGHVVAMTGDGVNDAPSLKQADIGIAMGQKGTDAAREVSEMVLVDDNFASIANAVEEGRGVYDNIRKTLLFILPTNGGQALTIVTAIALGLTLPLRPVHVLWVNMVVAVTLALALAFEPIERGVMRRKPREPDTPLLSGFLLWRVGFVSLLLLAGTFGHFLYELYLADTGLDHARTAAINTLVVGQVFYLFNSRYILEPSWNREGLFGSRAVWVAIGVLVILQGAFNYLGPFQDVFGTVPMGWEPWARILAFGVAVYVLVELEKAVFRWRDMRSQ